MLLGKTVKNPTALQVSEAFEHGWGNWAGMPEHRIIADRAKYFLGQLAEHMSQEGCHFDLAAKASPWQLGMVERAGGLGRPCFDDFVGRSKLLGVKICWQLQLSTVLATIWPGSHAFRPFNGSSAVALGFLQTSWTRAKQHRRHQVQDSFERVN